ncbi:MAG: outer membrane beta-barrel protein [Chitinophagales bacterium]|nr:outer membrane beta-barrel protein [Chitinophagales bacterium]
MKNAAWVLLIVLPLMVWGQNPTQEEKVMDKKDPIIMPALILGVNGSQVYGDDISGYRKFGANTGAAAFIRLPKNFSVSFEILYNMKGSRAGSTEVVFDTVYDYKLILDYIDVPVLINYHDKKRAIFGVGLAYTNLVRYKELRNNKPFEYPEGSPYKPRGMEIVGSVSFIFAKHYAVNIRYNHALLDITNRTLPFSDRKGGGQVNNYLSLRFMYLFN